VDLAVQENRPPEEGESGDVSPGHASADETPRLAGAPGWLPRAALVWGIALLWLALDLATKAWALRTLAAGELEIVPELLWFNLARNPGAAFGLFPGGRGFFIGISLVLMTVGLWAPSVMGERTSLGHVGLGLVLGGAAGNFYDRVFRGGEVIDFIDVRVWPVFNLADTGIVVGTVLVSLYLIGLERRKGLSP
jgi:signal peptidase II